MVEAHAGDLAILAMSRIYSSELSASSSAETNPDVAKFGYERSWDTREIPMRSEIWDDVVKGKPHGEVDGDSQWRRKKANDGHIS